MAAMEQLPSGCWFTPTPEQIVTDYLLKKARGEPLPWPKHIVERQLYGPHPPWECMVETDPWLVIPTDQGEISLKILYVFTTLKHMGPIRKARTAGCGCWHGETGSKPVRDMNGAEIGRMDMLSYVCHDENMTGTRGHWIMHQYSLSGSSLEHIDGKPVTDLVLCKITLDDSKVLKVKRKKEREDKVSKSRKKKKMSKVAEEGGEKIQIQEEDTEPSSSSVVDNENNDLQDFAVGLETMLIDTDEPHNTLPTAQESECLDDLSSHVFNSTDEPCKTLSIAPQEGVFVESLDAPAAPASPMFNVDDILAIYNQNPINYLPDLDWDIFHPEDGAITLDDLVVTHEQTTLQEEELNITREINREDEGVETGYI